MNSMKFKQKEVARIQKKVHWTLWVSACLYWLVKVCLYGLVNTLQVPIALSLVAGGDLHVPHALLALHVAAPVELALAPLRPPLAPRGVAPVAAQQVATIDPLGSRVALPALGAETALLDVVLTVVGRDFQVDQICVLMGSKFVVFRQQHSSTILPLLLDFMCSIKLLFQHSSDHSEGSKGPPARLELAGSAHSVAFAFHLHCPLQKLSAGFIVMKVHQ